MNAKTAALHTQPLLSLISAFFKREAMKLFLDILMSDERLIKSGTGLQLPVDIWKPYAAVTQQDESVAMVASLFFAWRYTQNVAVFDDEMAEALDRTEDAKISLDIFKRLLGQPLYLPLEGVKIAGEHGPVPIAGVLAGLVPDQKKWFVSLLFIGEDCSSVLPIGFYFQSANDESDMRWLHEVFDEQPDAALTDAALKVVNRILYICSDMPEAAEFRQSLQSQTSPFRKTKKGTKLFPPDKPRFFVVGEAVGTAIREAKESAKAVSNGASKRPHIRRAHWHTYYYGPRSAEHRIAKLHWNPPAFVNFEPAKNS